MTDKKETEKWINAHKIEAIECLVPDIAGNARGKFIPADMFIKKQSIRMPEGILTQSVTGEFPNDYWDLIDTLDGDMHLRTGYDYCTSLVHGPMNLQHIIQDCYTGKGEAHPLSSRNILKHILFIRKQKGMEPIVAPEMEFYLVKRNTDPRQILTPMGRSGRQETARQSYSIDATNEFKPFVDTLYNYGKTMDLDIDMLIHESGAAQFEINFMHGSAY